MNNKTVTYSSGMGIGTLVWIVLIILRLTGCIAMGWFWVLTSIIWVPLGILLVVFLIILVFIIVGKLC
jgi:hypothetical protein